MEGESESDADWADTRLTASLDMKKGKGKRKAPKGARSDPSIARGSSSSPAPVITIDDGTDGAHERLNTSVRSRTGARFSDVETEDVERSFVYLAENSIEAKKISNNYMFGLKKWKSHVTSRPLMTRSEIVQDLYADINSVKGVKVSTIRPFNVMYCVFFGWWVCLVYALVGLLMSLTVIGLPYGKLCWRLGRYFFWPFGKFVHQIHKEEDSVLMFHKMMNGNGPRSQPQKTEQDREDEALLGSTHLSQPSSPSEELPKTTAQRDKRCCWGFWNRSPATYVWLILGLPILVPVHCIVWGICWFFVITMPTAKLNSKTLTRILYLPPEEVRIGNSDHVNVECGGGTSEIIMYTHQSVNFYYYKYTVDGVNIILANLLLFVVLSLILGYFVSDSIIDGVTKCILGVLAIIPLTYYIGMAITSIAAQSSFAVGAILNATFGSMVEVILFVIMLKKGHDSGEQCYQELVKSSLTGAILCSILFIPGMSMVLGGLKFRTQRFNPKSASISASLLFVAIVGVFAPTLFSNIFGSLHCTGCEGILEELKLQTARGENTTAATNNSKGFICSQCEHTLNGPYGDKSLYEKHIEPLVYAVSIVMPIAYVIGLLFTMKTHSAHVFEEFEQQLKEENVGQGHHGTAQWSRLKSTVILLACAVAIALCADLISENIQPLLEETGISEYFIGVTVLSLVTELPEVVNGVQFALQNNVNLGIEIGCSTAIQVCLVQIPVLVAVNLIYPMGLVVIFNNVHLWSVIFSVIIINYIFQDGKSDYFQGTIVVFIYILLMCMYYFMLTPEHAACKSSDGDFDVHTTTTVGPTTTGGPS